MIPILRKVYFNLKKTELELELKLLQKPNDQILINDYILNQVYQEKYEKLPELLTRLNNKTKLIKKLKSILPSAKIKLLH